MCDECLAVCGDCCKFFAECCRAACQCFIDCCRLSCESCRDCCRFCWEGCIDCCTACCQCLKRCIVGICNGCASCCVATYEYISFSPLVAGCGRCCVGCRNFCIDCCDQCQDCCLKCCETYCKAWDVCCRQCCTNCSHCLRECCETCATKFVAACACCCSAILTCIRCGYVRPCCEKTCDYITYYFNKCELCIRRCCYGTRSCCKERSLVESCCCCVQDLNLSVLLISLIAILTNPVTAWGSVRHAYVIRISPMISWMNKDFDTFDFSFKNLLVFGFGSSAGLAESCLSTNSTTNTKGANSEKLADLNDVITYLGITIAIADVLFLIASIVLFICVLKRTFYWPAVVFFVIGLLSLVLTLAYSSVYIKTCITLGKSFPIGQFVFLLLDFFVWAYFLNVVLSYLRWYQIDNYMDPYKSQYRPSPPPSKGRAMSLPENQPIDQQPRVYHTSTSTGGSFVTDILPPRVVDKQV